MSEAVLTTVDAIAPVRRAGVLWLAYGTAARHLIRLMAPAVLVFPPIALLALLGPALLPDGSVALVNGSFELLGAPGRPLLAWTAAVVVATLAGQVVVVSATVVLAARLLTGRPVATSGAIRVVARNLPALLWLAPLGLVVCAAIGAAGFGAGLATGNVAAVVFAVLFLGLPAMPCLLAVPFVVLEGRSAGSAVVRAYGLMADGFWPSVFTLAFGVLVFPAAAQQAVRLVPGSPLVQGVTTSVLALLVPAFQATVIARLYLNRLAFQSPAAHVERVVEDLPGGGPSKARPVSVLVAALLPGLLYGGALLANPFGWLEVTQTVVTASWSRDGESPLQEDGRPVPGLTQRDLLAMYPGQGSRVVMFMDGFELAKLLTCADSSCSDHRFRWAEPAGADEDVKSAGARLLDGRIAVTTWYQQGQDDDWRARLGLVLCDATGCVPTPGGKRIAEATPATGDRTVALASGRYGGLLIAQLRELPWREGDDRDRAVLTVTTCEDPACTDPRTREVTKLPASVSSNQSHGFAVAADPLNRPVVVHFDERIGALSVITCEEVDCAEVHLERPVHGGWTWDFDYFGEGAGAALVVRDDGRPLIAYRDAADGSVRLLDCRNLSCSQADTVVLSGPGRGGAPPALVVDQDGRALVAYQDLDRDQLVIAACTGTRCAHTPVARSRYAFGEALAMTLDGRGRPVIGWIDYSSTDWDLVVTTPLNFPSIAGAS